MININGIIIKYHGSITAVVVRWHKCGAMELPTGSGDSKKLWKGKKQVYIKTLCEIALMRKFCITPFYV